MGVRSTTVSVQLLVHVALYIQYARALYRAWGGGVGGGGGWMGSERLYSLEECFRNSLTTTVCRLSDRQLSDSAALHTRVPVCVYRY